MAEQEVKLIVKAIDDTKNAFSNINANLKKLEGAATAIKTAFAGLATYLSLLVVQSGMEKLIQITDSYNTRIAETAALWTTFTKKTQDVAIVDIYRQWRDYAGEVYQKLGEIDAQILGTRQQAMEMVGVFAQHGQVVDIANQKQLEGLRNIINAVQIITQGQNQEIQIRQEINALMNGTVNQNARLMQLLENVDPKIKEHLKTWREEGTVIENIGRLLQGFDATVSDLENIFQAQKSTLESIVNDIIREGFTPLYQDIVSAAKELIGYLQSHKEELADILKTSIEKIKAAWEFILNTIGLCKPLLNDIWSVLRDGILPITKIFGATLAAIAGVALPTAVTILSNMYKLLQAMVLSAMALGAALTRDFSQAKFYSDRAKESISSMKNVIDVAKQSGAGLATLFEAINQGTGATSKTSKEKSAKPAFEMAKPKTQVEELKKLGEEWTKVKRDLATDIVKSGLDEFEQKIVEIENRAEDLKQKFGKIPGAIKEIDSWLTKMKEQITWEKQWKEYEEYLKKREDGEKRYVDLINTLQTSTANEMENRIQKSIQEETKLTKELTKIWTYSEMTYEEYQERLKEIEERGARERAKIREEYDLHKIEAESRRRLALLDIAEKEMSMSKEDIARGRIAEYEKMLSYYENIRQKAIEAGDITARIQAEDKIAEINTKLNELNMTMKELTGSFTEGWVRGLTEYLYNLKTTFQLAKDIAAETASAMQQAFSDFFFDAFEGKLKSLADYLNSFLSSVKRALANALGQRLTGVIASGIGRLFGSAGGTSVAMNYETGIGYTLSKTYVATPVQHGGGFPYEAKQFRLIPRFHTGVGPDEVLSIIRKDEAVFTPGQMKALGSAIKSPNIKIEIHNNSGTPITARQQDVKVNPSEIIVPIVVDAIQRNVRGLRDMLGGK